MWVHVPAAVFPLRCGPRLSGQVTHRVDLFSSDPRPQLLLSTADVSLVPCPISHNPLPLFQQPMFPYCLSHLCYIAKRPTPPVVFFHLWPTYIIFFLLVCSNSVSMFSSFIHPHPISHCLHTLTSP